MPGKIQKKTNHPEVYGGVFYISNASFKMIRPSLRPYGPNTRRPIDTAYWKKNRKSRFSYELYFNEFGCCLHIYLFQNSNCHYLDDVFCYVDRDHHQLSHLFYRLSNRAALTKHAMPLKYMALTYCAIVVGFFSLLCSTVSVFYHTKKDSTQYISAFVSYRVLFCPTC